MKSILTPDHVLTEQENEMCRVLFNFASSQGEYKARIDVGIIMRVRDQQPAVISHYPLWFRINEAPSKWSDKMEFNEMLDKSAESIKGLLRNIQARADVLFPGMKTTDEKITVTKQPVLGGVIEDGVEMKTEERIVCSSRDISGTFDYQFRVVCKGKVEKTEGKQFSCFQRTLTLQSAGITYNVIFRVGQLNQLFIEPVEPLLGADEDKIRKIVRGMSNIISFMLINANVM